MLTLVFLLAHFLGLKKELVAVLKFLLAYILIFPVMLITFLVNELARLVVRIMLWKTDPKKKMMPMGLLGNSFYYMEPNTGGMNLGVKVSSDPICLEKERERWEEALKVDDPTWSGRRLLDIPDCKYGYTNFSKVKNFKVEDHVRLYTETKPKDPSRDYFTEEEFFNEIIPKMSDYMLTSSRPNWEWVVIPRVILHGTMSSVRLGRFHQFYMDGFCAIMFYMRNIYDKPYPEMPVDPIMNLTGKKWLALLATQILGFISIPLLIADTIVEAYTKQKSYDPLLALKSAGEYSFGMSRPVSASKLRGLVKKCGKGHTATTAVQQIFRDAITQVKKGDSIELSLPMAVLPYPDEQIRNRITFVTRQVPLKGDEPEVPQQVSSREVYGRYFIMLWADRLPRFIFKYLTENHKSALASCVLSMLPMSKTPARINGGRIRFVGFWSYPKQPVGLFITAFSWGGEITFCYAADKSVITKDEVDHIVEDMVTQMEKCD